MYCLYTCSRYEYSWNTTSSVTLTLTNNQSINHGVKKNVIISDKNYLTDINAMLDIYVVITITESTHVLLDYNTESTHVLLDYKYTRI
jgi:hypothetical protein